ncbi:phosphotransferase [Streptomyces sp. NPDC029003]|uniref:phosphotransferase n=1 Tax=Streptomyces sp. NPDC029003 TaxID=3155125 RepID=UPI0033EA233F
MSAPGGDGRGSDAAPAGPGVARVMRLIAAGCAEALEGRGVNASYRLTDGGRELSVKVHCPERSGAAVPRRVAAVDAALRGCAWYPPVLDLGLHPGGRPRLVVVRPFVPGAASEDAREHAAALAGVLTDLAGRADGLAVAEETVGDYASAWLADGERERALAAPFLTGRWTPLARVAQARLGELVDGAARLTRTDAVVVHHGDLHGRNLIRGTGAGDPLTVIDWDETGFSRRPADAAKALWLTCRAGRGDFVLDPAAVRAFLEHLDAGPGLPCSGAADLARLGALWFLPREGHLRLLGERGADLVPWYLDWVARFWARFPGNLERVERVAANLPAGRRPGPPRRPR